MALAAALRLLWRLLPVPPQCLPWAAEEQALLRQRLRLPPPLQTPLASLTSQRLLGARLRLLRQQQQQQQQQEEGMTGAWTLQQAAWTLGEEAALRLLRLPLLRPRAGWCWI